MNRQADAYNEQVLIVDLTAETAKQQTLPAEWINQYLGGRGIAARLLWDEMGSYAADALGAPLIFSTGTLAGTCSPMSGRTTVTCVSPVTTQYFKSNVGGHFALQAKLNGIDHLVLRGVANRPLYMWIDNGRVEFRSAEDLWGMTVRETSRQLEATHGNGVNVTCIGPAGENLVAYATIMTSYYNAAGRGGVGMLMGSKRLKAIVLARPKGIRLCTDSETFRDVLNETRDALYADTMARSYYDFGTAAGISIKNEIGTLPSFNFRQGYLDPIEELTSEHWNESGKLKRRVGCGACIYGCHRHVRIDVGRYAGAYSGGPEYESVSSLGTGPGVPSIGAVQRSNELCNDLGLDTISVGGAIQWLMETHEKGLLPLEYQTGFDLSFGSEDAVVELPRMIAERSGIGDLLADGVKAAAERIGGDTWKWAIHTRGLEQSRVETRCSMGYALAFAVNPRGPDHLHTQCIGERGHTPEARALMAQIVGDPKYVRADVTEKRAEIVRWHEDVYAASDALGLCSFTTTASYGSTPQRMSALFSALTGRRLDELGLRLVGRRIVTLERLLNLRLGWTHAAANQAPWRILHEPFEDRSGRRYMLSTETLSGMVREYRELHGWDLESGIPREETLDLLGLRELAAEMSGG
ncbi:MAG: aldehyde ferredoxin oxidoreductase family protein [Lentisphaeria bacterium]|nr:aldehyde ferredoxin oxidoreductase family protein [Lentisphaeria bacterium]